MNGSVKDGVLTLSIPLAKDAYVSATEQAKADKEGRKPVAKMRASSGGFTRIGDVRVSFNVMD